MKNKSLLIASVFAVTAGSVSAQDLTSKKGEPFLPEQGDWALGVDAVPFLNYFGQMLSNAGATSPAMDYTNNPVWAIRGKYYSTATMAFRGGLRIGFGSNTWTNKIAQPQASTVTPPEYPAESPTVEDEYKASYNSIVLTGGVEVRKGKTRLQGYYGGELWVGFSGTKDAYTYGNALSSGAAPDPTITVANSTDWSTMGGNANMVADPLGAAGGARVTERKMSMMTVGLRGYIGVEYFLFPKISVGGEFGWGLGLNSTKTSTTTESNDIVPSTGNYAIGTFTNETKTSGFAIDSDIQYNRTGLGGPSGNLNIYFHF